MKVVQFNVFPTLQYTNLLVSLFFAINYSKLSYVRVGKNACPIERSENFTPLQNAQKMFCYHFVCLVTFILSLSQHNKNKISRQSFLVFILHFSKLKIVCPRDFGPCSYQIPKYAIKTKYSLLFKRAFLYIRVRRGKQVHAIRQVDQINFRQ